MKLPNLAEVKVRDFLSQLSNGKADPVKDELIKKASLRFEEALIKQLKNSSDRKEFSIRMSNVGRANCQLWFSKNHPKEASDNSYTFPIKMLYGDIIEVLVLLFLEAAGITIKSNNQKVSLSTPHGNIQGEYDVLLGDNKIWDIKSASPYAYEHKFKDFESLEKDDSFGYVAQGFGYAQSIGKEFGGWIVVNKSTGDIKFVEADTSYKQKYLNIIHNTKKYLDSDAPFKKSYEDVEEKFRNKITGNRHLGINCVYCDYKHLCWKDLQYREVVQSQAKSKPWRYYTVYHEKE